MIEVGLAVGASVGWGASEFVAGVASRRWPVIVVLAGSQLASLVIIAAIVLVVGAGVPSGRTLAYALAAGVFEVAGFAALYKALASGPMGPVAPVAALGGLVPLSVSLAEGGSLATTSAAGIALGLLGIVLVSWDGDDPAPRTLTGPLVLAGLASLCFGMFFILLQRASASGDALEAVALGRVAAVAVTAPFLVHHLRRARLQRRADDLLARVRAGADRGGRPVDAVASRDERSGTVATLAPPVAFVASSHAPASSPVTALSTRDLGVIVAVGLLDVAANGLYATSAGRTSDVGVQIVASACPVATVLLARLVLGERLSGIQAVGVWVTIAGVLLIGGG